MIEVQAETRQWKAYDGTLFTDIRACENYERGVAKLNAGKLTVVELINWIRDSTFQSGQDIGWLGEILHERQQWIKLQKAEEVAS